jgi:hypothetical protein
MISPSESFQLSAISIQLLAAGFKVLLTAKNPLLRQLL